MKKFYILVSLTLCFLILAACGSAKQTKSNIKEGEVSYVDMLPSDDIFENGEFTIIDSDGGTMYAFYVSDYTDDEYDEYVSECKELDLMTSFMNWIPDMVPIQRTVNTGFNYVKNLMER